MALFPRASRTTARAGLLSDIRTKTTAFRLEINDRKLNNLDESVRLKCRTAIQKATYDLQLETQKVIRDKDIIDTGFLLNSINSYSSLDGMTGTVLVGAFYGIYIEFGTVRKAARPFLGPAVTTIKPEFFAAIRQAVREGIEQA